MIVSVKCEEREYVFYPLRRPRSKKFQFFISGKEGGHKFELVNCLQKHPVKSTLNVCSMAV